MSAGIPQLVLPVAYDQTDNAIRVKRLGAGDWVRGRATGARIAAALSKLQRPETHACCRDLSRRIGAADPMPPAADCIEALVDGTGRR
jgi:rhamnosyltransferase subunit B